MLSINSQLKPLLVQTDMTTEKYYQVIQGLPDGRGGHKGSHRNERASEWRHLAAHIPIVKVAQPHRRLRKE